jgi:uridine monophosphate synthetase
MSFFTDLEKRCQEVNSLLCIGLDPHPADLNESTPSAVRDFCLRIISSTYEYAAAFKPNSAFFETLGAQGMAVLQEVIASVPDGIPVILDAKRGDIASTAEAYAQAAFHTLGADALTCSPYLGRDSLEPFLVNAEKGVFLLCKTSNPGAGDLQDLPVVAHGEKLTVYETVASLATTWNQKDNLGLVVGATHPQALQRVRMQAPNLWILVPGVGVQGGDILTVLRAGLRADGLGLLFPISRQISRAVDPGMAARNLRDEINRFRKEMIENTADLSKELQIIQNPKLERLALALLEAGCVRFGDFVLKSGLHSPIYVDLRQLVGFPELLGLVAEAYFPILKALQFQHLAALPYAAVPIATAISLYSGWSLVYPRKEVKEYGTRAEVEGVHQPGERVVVIDDLTTTGGSKFEAIDKLRAVGLAVQDVVVLIDRQSGAREALAKQGYRLHAVFTLLQLLDIWERTGKVTPEQIEAARTFIHKKT